MIALRALGKAEIITPAGRLTPSQEILFAVALYLFLERAKPLSRATMAGVLWPDIAEPARQHRLRQTIFQLKQAGVPLEATRETVALPAESRESDLDVLFIHGAGDIGALESLQFLPGYAPAFSTEFSHWLDLKRTEVSGATSRLLINDIRRARSRGDWLRVERLAFRCMEVDPFNEEAVLARAEASAMRGAKREAVTILDQYVADLGAGAGEIKLPANLMRKRIAERIPEAAFGGRTEGIFVGRETDMNLLTALLDDARSGKGRCCLLWGDAGIGKSRLAAELGKFGELQGVQVRRVACRRGDAQRPLSVFVEAVPQLREMRGALGCSPDTMADLQRLTQFDAGSSPKAAMELDPQSIFELIRLAIFDLIDAVSEEQCLMLIVEDVHWLDAASARILGQLADWAVKKQLLLLFTSRMRENPLLEACTRAGLVTYHLRPLSDEAATQLVREMFDATNEQGDEDFLAWCRTVGDGNPFFLHELVKQWLETKQRHVIPPSITTVIRERFSRLSSEGTQLLQACSVLGENSTLPRVEKMLQQEPYMLLGALNELSKTSMLSAERKPVGGSKDFKLAAKHDLISMVALEELDPHASAFLHRRAAEVLEAELGEVMQDTSLLWACAQHWEKAGNEERGYTLALSCAELLNEVGCPKEAANLLAVVSKYNLNAQQKLELFSRRLVALELASDWLELLRVLREARLAKIISSSGHDIYELREFDARWRTEVDHNALISNILLCVEANDASPTHRISAASLALKIATDLCDDSLLDHIYLTVEPLLDPSSSLIDNHLVPLIYHTMRGDGSKLGLLTAALISAAEQSPDVHARTVAIMNAGFAHQVFGDLETAERLLLAAFETAMKAKLVERARHLSLEIIRFYIDKGELSEARRWLNSFDHSAVAYRGPHAQAHLAFAIAKLAVAEGNVAEAEENLALLNRIPPEKQTAMRRNATLAVSVRLALLKNSPHDEFRKLVTEMEPIHLRNRKGGRQDFESYSLYLGLLRIGETERAQALIREYLRYRRERNAPPAEIERAAASIG
jgi:DNA-binding SARP family transcriptional activator